MARSKAELESELVDANDYIAELEGKLNDMSESLPTTIWTKAKTTRTTIQTVWMMKTNSGSSATRAGKIIDSIP